MSTTGRENARVHHLDGLRGILALSVAISHALGFITGWQSSRPFAGAGLAVLFFFVLSGFVLSGYLEKSREPARQFIVTRFLRLWPLHAFCLMLACVAIAVIRARGGYAPEVDIANPLVLLFNFGFLQRIGVGNVPIINDPSWSIGVEFWISAFLMLILARSNVMVPIAALVGSAAMLLTTGNGRPLFAGMATPHISAALLSAIEGMSIGVLMYRLARRENKFGWSIPPYVSKAGFWLCGGVCAYALYVAPSRASQVLGLIAFVPFLLVHQFNERGGMLKRWLESAPLQWLGRVSFSLYLSHLTVETAALPLLRMLPSNDFVSTLLFVGLSLVVAALVYRLVERPADDMARRMRGKPSAKISTQRA